MEEKKKKAPTTYQIEEKDSLNEPVSEAVVPYSSAFQGIQYLHPATRNAVPKTGANFYDLIALIRDGLSKKSLDYLMEKTSISLNEMSAILHTSDRTLRRYTPTTLLNPEQTERVLELARLYARGEEVFGSAGSFRSWMDTSILALGGRKPKELLDTSFGLSILMDELGRIEYGVFA